MQLFIVGIQSCDIDQYEIDADSEEEAKSMAMEIAKGEWREYDGKQFSVVYVRNAKVRNA